MRIGFAEIDLTENYLRVRPCQVEDAVRETPVLVLVDQGKTSIAIFSRPGDNVYRRRLPRIESDPIANSGNRVEY